MKGLAKILGFALLLPLCGFGKPSANTAQNTTVYVVEESSTTPNMLTVHLERPENRVATQLILRAAQMGVLEQVKNMACDGKPIKEDKPGVWSIASDCQQIQWQVPLLENGALLASAQQSMRSGNFILFSEASSLPRLQNTTASEILKISIPHVTTLFPAANSLGELALPAANSAPLFVLLNPIVVGTDSSDSIKLTYLLDNATSGTRLPTLSSHMEGLKWLNTIIPDKTEKNFTIAWLGISAKQLNLAGAAGAGVLLTNYPNDGELSFGKAMLLYVGLHEAFHQIAMHYPNQPAWVAESLASYYGIRALEVALPNDPATSALLNRFLASASHFQNGLVTINSHVKKSDRSEYAAFYTKGIAFWMAVDNALKQTQGSHLDDHLLAVLQATYNTNGMPINLQKNLNFSPETWTSIQHQFLD